MSENLRPSFAELSALQQHACVGMWVEYLPGDLEEGEFKIGVLTYYNYSSEEAAVISPDCGSEKYWAKFENVYPQYDLPRAWTPSGSPVSHLDTLLDLASDEDAENEREENTDE